MGRHEEIAQEMAEMGMEVTLLLRVTNPLLGLGPYREAWHGAGANRVPSLLQWVHNDDAHPGWRDDGLDRDASFAFQTPAKARSWFSQSQVETMDRHGYVLVLVVAESDGVTIGASGKQVAFDRQHASGVQSMRVRHLGLPKLRHAWGKWHGALRSADVLREPTSKGEAHVRESFWS